MARYSKSLTPAAQAVFLEALWGGAKLVEAAAAAGVAVSSLYCRRRWDPAFDSAWSEAAAGSWHEEVRVPAGGGAPRLVRTARRRRFSAELKAEFLRLLETCCDTGFSAREAAVHRSTVYRYLKRDPEFASANEAALLRGYAHLVRLAVAEREARRERLARLEPPPGLRPTRDFDRLILLLDRYRRPERPRRGTPPRPVRSFEETLQSLDARLQRRFGGGRPAGR